MTTELAQQTDNIPATASEILFNQSAFNQLARLADIMAGGKLSVPQHLAGNKSDCMAIAMQAAQWKMNPFAVAQKTYLVGGKLGYEAQLVNAIINSIAPVDGRLEYEFFGPWEHVQGKFKTNTSQKGNEYAVPGWEKQYENQVGVKAFATISGESKPREITVYLNQCFPRNSTMWAYDPQQQITYVATQKWARRYVPDVILGVYTPEELAAHSAIDITSRTERVTDDEPQDMMPKAKSKPDLKAVPKEEESKQEEPAQAQEQPAKTLSPGMIATLQKKCANAGVDESALAQAMGVEDIAQISMSDINSALKKVDELKG